MKESLPCVDYRGSRKSSLSSSGISSTTSSSKGEGNRLQVLSFEQVKRLDEVLSQSVPVHSSRPGYPPIQVCLKDFVKSVKTRLHKAGLEIRDIRLNGATASYIISDSRGHTYNDYDFIFGVNLSHNGGNSINQVKTATLDALMSFLPITERHRAFTQMGVGGYNCSLPETYIQKLFRIVNDDPLADYWSLIGVGCGDNAGLINTKSIELKFVERMRRPYEFTVDSFQIILDSLLTFYEVGNLPIAEHFYPTVVADSVAGSFQEALHHLNHKLIYTRNPEEIHGGGLLKYCRLLAEGYEAASNFDMAHLERYMCSRFFIDYSDVGSQRARIESYLNSHFTGQYQKKISYLETLRSVIWLSTVCLMNEERYQTLQLVSCLIQEISYQRYLLDHCQDGGSPGGGTMPLSGEELQCSTTILHTPVEANFVCQGDIGADDWALDEVFYGTQYFPDLLSTTMSVFTMTPNSSSASSPIQLLPNGEPLLYHNNTVPTAANHNGLESFDSSYSLMTPPVNACYAQPHTVYCTPAMTPYAVSMYHHHQQQPSIPAQ